MSECERVRPRMMDSPGLGSGGPGPFRGAAHKQTHLWSAWAEWRLSLEVKHGLAFLILEGVHVLTNLY